MTGKRKLDVSTYEVGESSRVRQSKRLSQLIDSVKNALPEYLDNGDCNYICEHCGAIFWFAERVLNASRHLPPKYSQCCKGGAVRLPFPLDPPPIIKQLFSDRDFMENIRAYNNMFSMTSFGAQIDNTINDGRGPYVFKVSGQVSHWIGSLCPSASDSPRFLQLYIYDTANEVSNRLKFFSNSDHQKLSEAVVKSLGDTLNSCNEYARMFKNAIQLCDTVDGDFSIRLYSSVGDRRYEPPAPGTLGGIVRADDSNASKYDIIVHKKDGTPQRVSKLHPSYIPLQYPLLFPFAEQGWSPDLKQYSNSAEEAKRLTVNMYYSYQIHDRHNVYSLLLNGGKLYQQYLVDAYTCIEENRLDYINTNQNLFRSEYVAGLYDAFARGDNNVENIGKRIFLPSSFTGGPRYMYKHYQDALAICRENLNPQYFVTFTCNVKWPEITRHLNRLGESHAQNRPDIIARVFHIKVQEFLKFIRSDKTFGDVAADLYTIEFQKRGLPHSHTLIWVTSPYRICNAVDVDNYISAEIPNPSAEPMLHKIVTEYMIHGPCGLQRPDSPCMRYNKCSKSFPKTFQSTTDFDKNGYARYRRRMTEHHAVKNGIGIDNRYVVPYNKRLSMRFNAHINVEYCGWNMMIKYLFKYISKGADRVRFQITKSEETSTGPSTSTNAPVNEIKNFVDGRYICPHEAAWRILNFPIHERDPAVQVLAVHLENLQNVTFKHNAKLEAIVRNPSFGKTTLTEWLRNNNSDPNGRSLTYMDYPSKYRWDNSAKTWIPMTRHNISAIGRLAYVHPASGELFYLRMLLCHQRGCKSYADIRTVANVEHKTYKSACEALGLIGDDRECLTAFVEASSWATSSELRYLFAHMLLFCEVSKPVVLWESQWKNMADDILLRLNSDLASENCFVNDDDLQQCVLLELETLLNSATPSKSLADFGLPLPSTAAIASLRNRLLMEETCYDRAVLADQHSHFHSLLNSDQLKVYNTILSSYQTNSQLLLFVYGHGGTGKTFLWTTIISLFRSTGKIVLAVAASGIASLLLPSGRTAHSRFKIPVDLTDQSTCHIKKNTQLAELLRQTTLIIWDEAPMSDRRCFECLDRTLRDIIGNEEHPFGGKSILLGGDFRQTLPVKPKCTNSQIVNSTLPRSYLWQHFRVFRLNENMRLTTCTKSIESAESASEFASWLLNIGDGLLGEPDINDPYNTRLIKIPPQYLIPNGKNSLKSLIQFIYDKPILKNPCAGDLSSRAIVCPTNETADEINKLVLTMTPGECKTYFSHDVIIPHSDNHSDLEALYPQECLSQLNFPGIPPYQLSLKANTPVILIRNINHTLGLCNGTRLIVLQLLPRIIEAQIITGTSAVG